MILLVLAIVGVSYYAMWTSYAPLLSSRSPARALLGLASLGTFTALVRLYVIDVVLALISMPSVRQITFKELSRSTALHRLEILSVCLAHRSCAPSSLCHPKPGDKPLILGFNDIFSTSGATFPF